MLDTVKSWITNWFMKKAIEHVVPKDLGDVLQHFDKPLDMLEKFTAQAGQLAAQKQNIIKVMHETGDFPADHIQEIHEEVGDHLLDVREATMIKENIKLLLGKEV